MTTVLLTGFEPFAGDAVNPSGDAVQLVAAEWTGPETLVIAVLPVTFAGAAERVRELIAEHSPDVVIATGLAGGRSEISIERVAVNLIDARIPDNDGAQPVDTPVVARGPAAYFSTLPIKRLREALAKAGIPAEISQTAGTYVCNHVFYGLMHALKRRPGVRGGFVHIPYSPVQALRHPGTPGLATDTVTDALRIVLREALRHADDLPIPLDAFH